MIKRRDIGPRSFALTMEIGIDSDQLLERMGDALAEKDEFGVPKYGYEMVSSDSINGGLIKTLKSVNESGLYIQIISKGNELYLCGGESFDPINLRLGKPTQSYVVGEMRCMAGNFKFRATFYVFASKDWLIIRPSSQVASSMFAYSINSALCIFAQKRDFGQVEKYAPGAISSCLSFMAGHAYYTYTYSTLESTSVYMVVRNRPAYVGREIAYTIGSSVNTWNVNDNRHMDVELGAMCDIVESNNGFMVGNVTRNNEPGGQTCSALRVWSKGWDPYKSRFFSNARFVLPGIKMLGRDSIASFMDKILIRCNDQYELDKEGELLEHIVITVNHSSVTHRYAVPS